MDERPKWTREQLELLETLRSSDETESDPALAPTREALEKDPQLAQRLDRILQWDASLSTAMIDVPVPPALAEQIIQGLGAASDQPTPAKRSPRADRRRRRRRWAAVTGVGLGAILAVVVMLGNRLPEMEPKVLRTIASERFMENRANEPKGTLTTESDPPPGFQFSPDLIHLPGTRWRRVETFDRAKAVAYDIPLGPSQKATIYVVRCRSSSLAQSPPGTPRMLTQSIAIATWQGDGVVYVAVFEGGQRTYRFLLKSTSRSLT